MKFSVILLLLLSCFVSAFCKRVIMYRSGNEIHEEAVEETTKIKVEQSNIFDVPLRSCKANEQRDPRGKCRRVVR